MKDALGQLKAHLKAAREHSVEISTKWRNDQNESLILALEAELDDCLDLMEGKTYLA